MNVAALCVAGNSIYKGMPGVICYDKARDARQFTGGMPVVAHPPCRFWSAYTAHQAKFDGEAERAAAWARIPCVSNHIEWQHRPASWPKRSRT